MNEKLPPYDVSVTSRPLFMHQLDDHYGLWRVEDPKWHEKPIYHIKEGNDLKLIVNLDFSDSFAISWGTDVTIDDFLKQASQLIDRMAKQKYKYRPMETGEGTAIASIPIPDGDESAAGVLTVDPSYSNFGYNNVEMIPWPTSKGVPFDKLVWPLRIEDIVMVGIEETGIPIETPTNPDAVFIRINAEFCTILLDSFEPKLHRPIAYWSHIPAIGDINRMYQETASKPIPEDIFRNVARELIPSGFQQNVNQQ